MSIESLSTPCLLLDKTRLVKNINRVQHIANQHNIRLRPHIKTHKCKYVYNLQEQAGAIGITASKPREAMPFIRSKVPSVKLVYPIVDSNQLKSFLAYVKTTSPHTEIILCLDSEAGFEAIVSASEEVKFQVKVQILINVGYNRCGLLPGDARIQKLVRKIDSRPYIYFLGLATHNGNTYGAKDHKQIAKLNTAEIKQVLNIKKKLKKIGFNVEEFSAGSTPGTLGHGGSLSGIDELRPGNYVFMDRTPYELGLIKKKQVALSVLSQIISENSSYYIIDAGKKVLSSDQRKGVNDFGLVYPWDKFGKRKKELSLARLSEEHGFIQKRKGTKHKIGDKVRILPNHSCVVANLASEYCLIDNLTFIKTIPIEAIHSSHGIQSTL